MTGPDTRAYFDAVLTRIATDTFGQRAAPVARLSSDTALGPQDTLSGAVEIFVRTRTGDEPMIYREAFSDLRTRQDVDDVVARALSTALMNHPRWPR